MSSGKGGLLLFSLLLLGLGAAGKPSGRTTMAFVVDTSQSMRTDVRRFAAWATVVLPAKREVVKKRFDHFVIVPFGGQGRAKAISTGKTKVLVESLKSLTISKENVCKRRILHAILSAAKEAKPDGVVLVITNGRPSDEKLEQEVTRLVQRRGIHLIFALTGCCGRPFCLGGGDDALKRLAKASKGVVYRIGEADVQQIVKMITVGDNKAQGFPSTFARVLKLNSLKGLKRKTTASILSDKNFEAMDTACKEKKLTSRLHRFLHGCNMYMCSKDGLKIVEKRCDANHDGWDCRKVSESWKCHHKGAIKRCTCISDAHGVLIKIH